MHSASVNWPAACSSISSDALFVRGSFFDPGAPASKSLLSSSATLAMSQHDGIEFSAVFDGIGAQKLQIPKPQRKGVIHGRPGQEAIRTLRAAFPEIPRR
jgi:hypothetical protein